MIVGSSTAGLTTSIAMKRKFPNYQIQIIESGNKSGGRAREEKKGTFVGLWTPALKGLKSLGLYYPLADSFEPVEKSCYRSKYGRVLLEPNVGLRDPRLYDITTTSEHNCTQPSLMFIDEDHLLDTFTDIVTNEYGVDISYNTSVEDLVSTSSSSCKVVTSLSSSNGGGNGCDSSGSNPTKEIEANLVVAADGCFSAVRRIAQRSSSSNSSIEERGYIVYRGYTKQRLSDVSFQTWGVGCRFACVPVKGGNAWFAAISKPKTASIIEGQDRAGNGGVRVALGEFFKDYHDPINKLIDHTEGNIRIDGSYASQEVKRLNSFHLYGGERVVFVGDAAHTMDPILAQGR